MIFLVRYDCGESEPEDKVMVFYSGKVFCFDCIQEDTEFMCDYFEGWDK